LSRQPRRHRVRWTRLALADLQSSFEHIAERNPGAAQALLARIRGAVRKLRELPNVGRLVPERRAQGYREIVVPPYRLVYAIAGRAVHILRVWHGRRDPQDM
jgi:addiction module RelE/StbE family toxin